MTTEERRTKRRYAHELFPHAEEGKARRLEVEVPYRIARAIGFDPQGTSWFDMDTKEQRARTVERTMQHINESRLAMLAIALHKGLTGDDAWRWADEGMGDGEMWRIYESAPEYGVDIYAIKPYPCGPEPDHHDHLSEPHRRHGFEARTVTRVEGKESDCAECTAPLGAPE